ncbi:putative NADH:ubiquinone reductase (H(+)-translocating) [Rosa chinensis]|uniref:Putative NADH:ubiquinone reductase (H(+)-translocating) n=1 Tax=Rosa chinensis TaxID=74649 RepID=A0A2P6SBM3_ROSCH|nr:uncharacterized protein At2g27730, mitochondrial [Rosa chinensis]PRQ56074.1 putative NADH:ubiquinone reductase (H(+)-translocating) [Rosa chinensis]
MAMRSVQSRVVLTRALLTRSMESSRGATRYYSDGKGKILSEEERAAENVYIKKMERERLEKLKQKAAKESAENEKVIADKKTDGTH